MSYLPPSVVAARLRALADWIDLHRPEGITDAGVHGYTAGDAGVVLMVPAEVLRLDPHATITPVVTPYGGGTSWSGSYDGVKIGAYERTEERLGESTREIP